MPQWARQNISKRLIRVASCVKGLSQVLEVVSDRRICVLYEDAVGQNDNLTQLTTLQSYLKTIITKTTDKYSP